MTTVASSVNILSSSILQDADDRAKDELCAVALGYSVELKGTAKMQVSDGCQICYLRRYGEGWTDEKLDWLSVNFYSVEIDFSAPVVIRARSFTQELSITVSACSIDAALREVIILAYHYSLRPSP